MISDFIKRVFLCSASEKKNTSDHLCSYPIPPKYFEVAPYILASDKFVLIPQRQMMSDFSKASSNNSFKNYCHSHITIKNY